MVNDHCSSKLSYRELIANELTWKYCSADAGSVLKLNIDFFNFSINFSSSFLNLIASEFDGNLRTQAFSSPPTTTEDLPIQTTSLSLVSGTLSNSEPPEKKKRQHTLSFQQEHMLFWSSSHMLCIDYTTRGHSSKLYKPRANTKLRLHSFSNRVIDDWNKLNNETVCSQTIN